MRPTAVVAGAGIAGLTAALALERRGWRVTVLERRTGLTEAGAGIQLSPNASGILIQLGLGPALARVAGEPDAVVIHARGSGRIIGGARLGAFMRERFGAPYWLVHRADLQTILLDVVRARPGIRLLVGREVAVGDDGAVRVTGAGGASEALAADLVVGADGIRSRLRRAVDGPADPAFAGYEAWRASVERGTAAAALTARDTHLWLGRRGHVVHYPMAGGRLVNIVAVMRAPEAREGWSEPGDPALIRRAHADAAPALRALIEAAADWRVWSLSDRRCGRMARGRIALVGDAARPVLPFLAQGGALGIEDAATLAACLPATPADLDASLRTYEALRQARSRRVQDAARRNGRIYHLGWPLALARDHVMARLGPEGLAERYAWLYGWTPPGPIDAAQPGR